MSRLPRRGLLLLGTLVVLLTVLAGVTSGGGGGSWGPPLSTHSNHPNGARALALWLAGLGYRTSTLEFRAYQLDPDIDVVFVLSPTRDFATKEVAEVVDWVERGGTLVVAGEKDNALLEELGVDVSCCRAFTGTAVASQPLLADPPVTRVAVDSPAELVLDAAWVSLLTSDDGTAALAASRKLGLGRVVVLASEHALSNAGIGAADNGALVLSLLAGTPGGGRVVFDEYHHGLTEHGTLLARLVREPWGWALLYAGVAVFVWMAFAGRRFGRAVPPAYAIARRSSAEYVATLGGLLHRGRHDGWLREHYVAQVKRALGSRYRVPADLPAVAFVAQLVTRRAEAAALAAPLERLESAARLDEATTVTLMRDVDRLERELLGQRGAR